jgi:hypothetical protein
MFQPEDSHNKQPCSLPGCHFNAHALPTVAAFCPWSAACGHRPAATVLAKVLANQPYLLAAGAIMTHPMQHGRSANPAAAIAAAALLMLLAGHHTVYMQTFAVACAPKTQQRTRCVTELVLLLCPAPRLHLSTPCTTSSTPTWPTA